MSDRRNTVYITRRILHNKKCTFVVRSELINIIPSQDGETALTLASDCGHVDVVQQLLSGGIQLDSQDEVRYVTTELLCITLMTHHYLINNEFKVGVKSFGRG